MDVQKISIFDFLLEAYQEKRNCPEYVGKYLNAQHCNKYNSGDIVDDITKRINTEFKENNEVLPEEYIYVTADYLNRKIRSGIESYNRILCSYDRPELPQIVTKSVKAIDESIYAAETTMLIFPGMGFNLGIEKKTIKEVVGYLNMLKLELKLWKSFPKEEAKNLTCKLKKLTEVLQKEDYDGASELKVDMILCANLSYAIKTTGSMWSKHPNISIIEEIFQQLPQLI